MERGLGLVYKRNSVEFLVDFRELGYFRNLLSNRLGVRIPVFQMGYDILMPCGFLTGFQETGTHSRTCGDCHVSTLRVEAWQFDSRSELCTDPYTGLTHLSPSYFYFGLFLSFQDAFYFPIFIFKLLLKKKEKRKKEEKKRKEKREKQKNERKRKKFKT